MRIIFVRLGNSFHRFETKVNRKFLKLETNDDFFVKPLNEDLAVEKGVEFFYEIVIYAILIGLPIFVIHLLIKLY